MRVIKWILRIVPLLLIAAFLHYTLPQHDIVRVVNTYEERQDLGDWTRLFWSVPDTQSETLINRDVQFIQTRKADDELMVYRNEDTGWGWPPYFKFDTANLYTEANDAISSKDAPEWYAVKHYGWRNEFLSIFPNAVNIKPVDGPDARIIPWTNIAILFGLFLLAVLLIRIWNQFRERTIDPFVDDVEIAADHARDRSAGIWKRFTGWLGTWRGKPRV